VAKATRFFWQVVFLFIDFSVRASHSGAGFVIHQKGSITTMGIGTFGRAGTIAAAALVAACGGGDGGGSSKVALASEGDVTREITNVVQLVSVSVGPTAVAGPRMGVGKQIQARRTHALAARSAKPRPKAETFECSSGSGTADYITNTARSLPLFSANPTVDYEYVDYDNCRDVEGTSSYTDNGYEEWGSNYSYIEAPSANTPAYDYYVEGQGSGSYTFVYEDTDLDEKVTYRSKGRGEYRDNGTSYEAREVFDFSYVLQFEGFREELSFGAGDSGNPLVIVDNYSTDTFTIDGPFNYGYVDVCEGGRLVYDTVQPLAYTSDEAGQYINGGQLTLSSGGTDVTLTFQADGDITYSIDGGASGEVTRAELQAEEGCPLFVG
jgi:hypothetical protein